MALSTLTALCNCHHCLVPEALRTPKGNSGPISSHPPLSAVSGDQSSASCLWVCPFWAFHLNDIVGYVTFRDWLLSFSIRLSGVIRVGAGVRTVPF